MLYEYSIIPTPNYNQVVKAKCLRKQESKRSGSQFVWAPIFVCIKAVTFERFKKYKKYILSASI